MFLVSGSPTTMHPPAISLAIGCKPCTLWVTVLLSRKAVLMVLPCLELCWRVFIYTMYCTVQYIIMGYHMWPKGYVRKLITLQFDISFILWANDWWLNFNTCSRYYLLFFLNIHWRYVVRKTWKIISFSR